jgi:hypothetical protein
LNSFYFIKNQGFAYRIHFNFFGCETFITCLKSSLVGVIASVWFL